MVSLVTGLSQAIQWNIDGLSLFESLLRTGSFYSLLLLAAAWVPILLLREGLLILVDIVDTIVRQNPRLRDGLR